LTSRLAWSTAVTLPNFFVSRRNDNEVMLHANKGTGKKQSEFPLARRRHLSYDCAGKIVFDPEE
jgi:hypothetical protein